MLVFKECKTSDDFLEFFNNEEQEFRHTAYYHYTTLESADKILSTKALRLLPLSKTANDLIERDTYAEIGDNVFSACFSTGTSENLPLWYLYSGLDGRGVRLGIKKAGFENLCKNAEFELLEIEPVYPYEPIGSPKILSSTEYELKCRDILYIGSDTQNKNKYRAKHNGNVVNSITKDIASEVINKYKRFVKGLIWFYEKETRLQVEIKNKELLKADKNYAVELKLDSVYENISIRFGPECKECEENIFQEFKGIKKWALNQLQKSDFSGQLKMNLTEKLCSVCKNKL